MEILKDEKIVDILGCVHKSIMPFFGYYADRKGLMNFDGFHRFATDFEIFPTVLSKPKLMRFFRSLSGFFESTAAEEGTKVADVIDEHLFVEALALAAFEIVYQNP